MTGNLPVPPAKKADAVNRAVRTFVTGLIAAVLANVVPVLMTATGSIKWTKEWWLAEAAAVGLVALNAALSYIARYTHPPQP